MLAPAPPRCWTRSSTRNDSETFSIWPSTNCSANLPGNVIRWSVAMDPVTATGTGRSSWWGWNGRLGKVLARGGCTDGVVRWQAQSLGADRAERAGTPRPSWSIGQCAAQGNPQLDATDHAQEHPGRRPGDHDVGG